MERMLTSLLMVCFGVALSEAAIEHCRATMPSLKHFSIPGMSLGDPAVVRLSLESEYDLQIVWWRSIRTPPRFPGGYDEIYKVPISGSQSDYTIANAHVGRLWTSSVYIRDVTEEDLRIGRFQAEVNVLHRCNTLTMRLDVRRASLNVTDPNIIVEVKSFPIWTNRVGFGEVLNGGILVNYTSPVPLRHKPISVSKWNRYISRTGVRNYLFVLDDLESPWQNRSGNFHTNRIFERLSDRHFIAYSNMSLRPFMQRDQGVFQTHFTYNIGRSIKASVYVATELKYSDSLGAALKIKTCSSEALNDMDEGQLQLPVEAGYENCIQCFAHGAPLPKIYLAKINSDISTGISFVSELKTRLYGQMTKMSTYSLAPMRASEVQHYVCSAGRKHYVTSLVFKVVAFTKVEIVESTPARVNLQSLGEEALHFSCKATGFPAPNILFYRSVRNSALFDNQTPESLGWTLLTTGTNTTILRSFNAAEKANIALLSLKNAVGDFDYHCVATNPFSRQARTLVVDDFAVGGI